MKRLFPCKLLELFLLPSVLLSLSACKHNPRSLPTNDSQKTVSNSSIKSELTGDQLATYLNVVKNYAERYKPTKRIETEGKETREFPPFHIEMPEPDVAEALNRLAAAQSREHEKYLMLIVLRLYRTQVQMVNQSYDIRDIRSVSGADEIETTNPVAKEFCRLTGIECGQRKEFIPTVEAYNWAVRHPTLLEYEPIGKEVEMIEKVHRRIES